MKIFQNFLLLLLFFSSINLFASIREVPDVDHTTLSIEQSFGWSVSDVGTLTSRIEPGIGWSVSNVGILTSKIEVGISWAVSDVGTLNSITTGVLDARNLPTEYILDQNHPNPFNPTTIISYALPKKSHVIIKVYDIIGNEVETLVNKTQAAGYYSKIFIARNLSSGIYFYTINSEDYITTKKMILLK